jgi:hypothetical protein
MIQRVCCSGFISLILSYRQAYRSVSTFPPVIIVCCELIGSGKLSETLSQVAVFGAWRNVMKYNRMWFIIYWRRAVQLPASFPDFDLLRHFLQGGNDFLASIHLNDSCVCGLGVATPTFHAKVVSEFHLFSGFVGHIALMAYGEAVGPLPLWQPTSQFINATNTKIDQIAPLLLNGH